MPEELSALQAQDLIRGVKKVIHGSDRVGTYDVPQQDGISVEALLERAFIFIEDKELPNADRYLERVLDRQPRNARAYMGKLLIELDLTEEEQLISCYHPFYESKNFQKAIRYADSAYRKQLENYCDKAVQNMEASSAFNRPTLLTPRASGSSSSSIESKEKAYQRAKKRFEKAVTITDYEIVRDVFKNIIDYKSAKTYYEDCLRYIAIKEEQRQVECQHIYKEAIAIKERAMTTQQIESAKRKLESIRGYRDTQKHIQECVELREQMIGTQVRRVPPTGSPCSKSQ